jgi:hypothetical protein
MASLDNARIIASTFIKVGDLTTSIEKLNLDSGLEKIHIFSSGKDKTVTFPIILSEEELLEILHQAIHSGILPRNFIGKLRERIEI